MRFAAGLRHSKDAAAGSPFPRTIARSALSTYHRPYPFRLAMPPLRRRMGRRAELVGWDRTDTRAPHPAALPLPPDVVTIDVSSISLKLVLPAAIALAARPADIVALIKPQFELTRADTKKGIVRDAELHRRVCEEIAGFAAALGLTAIVQCDSPIAGADGNREFFVGGRLG